VSAYAGVVIDVLLPEGGQFFSLFFAFNFRKDRCWVSHGCTPVCCGRNPDCGVRLTIKRFASKPQKIPMQTTVQIACQLNLNTPAHVLRNESDITIRFIPQLAYGDQAEEAADRWCRRKISSLS